MEDSEELYIKIEQGKPVDHPITGWNLRMFYPDLNPEKLPEGFERFTRLPYPELGPFEKVVRTEYIQTNYGWTDHHVIEDTNTAVADNDTIEDNKKNYPPAPNDGKQYFWADNIEKWINYEVFEQVFSDFFQKNDIKYEDVNFKTLDGLTVSQKTQFKKLIEKYNNITNSN